MKKCCKKIVIIMSLVILSIPILIPTSNTPTSNTSKYCPLTIEESELRTNKY